MSLLKSLRSEILKTRRTGPLYFTIGAAAFAPFMSILDLLIDGVGSEVRQAPLYEMFIKKFQMTGLVALPIFVILVCTLLPQIEYKNNTWKQVLASPQTRSNVFAAKFINVQLYLLIFFIANLLFMFAGAVILHFMEPSINVFNQPYDGYNVVMIRVGSYVGVLAMCAIQFWLGLRFKNFITPIAIGIACWFAGTIVVMQGFEFAAWFPYSFHAYGKFPKYDPTVNTVGVSSLIYTVLFLGIAYLNFRKKRMHG